MALPKTKKQSYESYWIYGDFDARMQEGETIVSINVTAIDKDGADCTSILIAGDEPVAGIGDNLHRAFVRIKDGSESKSPYKVTIRVVTSLGNKWEADGNVIVKEN